MQSEGLPMWTGRQWLAWDRSACTLFRHTACPRGHSVTSAAALLTGECLRVHNDCNAIIMH